MGANTRQYKGELQAFTRLVSLAAGLSFLLLGPFISWTSAVGSCPGVSRRIDGASRRRSVAHSRGCE